MQDLLNLKDAEIQALRKEIERYKEFLKQLQKDLENETKPNYTKNLTVKDAEIIKN